MNVKETVEIKKNFKKLEIVQKYFCLNKENDSHRSLGKMNNATKENR